MFNYVYVLFSLKDRNLYIGRTNDIFKRLEKHNNGLVIATKSRRPLKLVHLEVFKDAGKAFWEEISDLLDFPHKESNLSEMQKRKIKRKQKITDLKTNLG